MKSLAAIVTSTVLSFNLYADEMADAYWQCLPENKTCSINFPHMGRTYEIPNNIINQIIKANGCKVDKDKRFIMQLAKLNK